MSRIDRSTDVRAALRSRQRGFLLNPFRFGGGGGSPSFPSSGLVSYYKLDSNSNDSLGANNGSDTSISYANAGRIGNCATFSGSSRITLTSGAPPTNTSVSLWFMRGNASAGEQLLYGWYATDGVIYWRISFGQFGNGRITLMHRSAASDYKLWDISNAVTDTTTLHHAVITQAGAATPVIYLDGTSRTVTLQASSGTVTKWTNTVSHTMGQSAFSSFPLSYTGRLDEVGLWNRVLTASEVSDLYNGGAGLTYP